MSAPDGWAPGDTETGALLADAVRRGADLPVDTESLAGGARTRATRIRRRRTTLTTAAAVVALVPVSVLGIQSVQHRRTDAVAAAAPASSPVSSPDPRVQGAGPVAPTPTDTGPRVITVTPASGQPIQLTATTRTRTIPGTTATTTYPTVTVSSGPANLGRTMQQSLNRRAEALIERYRQRVAALGAADASPAQTVEITADAHWRDTVSIVFRDSQDIPGSVPAETTDAVTLSTRTGLSVPAESLFTDVPAADALARKAVASAVPAGTVSPGRLAALTMRTQATGSTDRTTVTWYPAQDGLTWIVHGDDNDPAAPATSTVTIPWEVLSPLVRL